MALSPLLPPSKKLGPSSAHCTSASTSIRLFLPLTMLSMLSMLPAAGGAEAEAEVDRESHGEGDSAEDAAADGNRADGVDRGLGDEVPGSGAWKGPLLLLLLAAGAARGASGW